MWGRILHVFCFIVLVALFFLGRVYTSMLDLVLYIFCFIVLATLFFLGRIYKAKLYKSLAFQIIGASILLIALGICMWRGALAVPY